MADGQPHCGLCFDNADQLWPSTMYPGDRICEGCKTYEDYYLSLTPEERREEHRMADEYANEAAGRD